MKGKELKCFYVACVRLARCICEFLDVWGGQNSLVVVHLVSDGSFEKRPVITLRLGESGHLASTTLMACGTTPCSLAF